MAASDAESDHFGAFDISFSEFTEDDFAKIDTSIAGHFDESQNSVADDEIEHPTTTANESLEFDASLDLFNLTEEDLLEIDNAVNLQLNVVTPTPPPAPVAVQLPEPSKPGPSTRTTPTPRVPTPNVGWSTGKEIVVETKVAEKNDVVTKQGQAVHKELEREVRAEEIKIDVRTDEERWGLRLLNMIACFQILVNEGMIREVPVFGTVNDAVIIGVIDEISRVEKKSDPPKRSRASHSSPRKGTKRQKRTPSPHQADIEDYFIPSPRKGNFAKSSGKRREPGRFSLLLRDTKTRVKDSMPPEEDTRGSRLQLMLYRRLLTDLISIENPFDFGALWDKLGVDSHIEFSTGFLIQAGLIDANSGFATTTNLDGLVEAWKRILEASSIADVDPKLQLIYRLQPRAGSSNGNENGKGKEREASFAPNEPQPFNAEVRYNIAMEIRNSLLNGREGVAEGSSKENELDLDLQKILYESLVPHLPGVEEPPAEEPIETDIHGYKIVGRKNFDYDDAMLKAHLQSVFAFWRCERDPIGVPLELSRRCNTCEYRNGCEWREDKATEFSSRRTSLEGNVGVAIPHPNSR
ncbi:hypothetical protein MD484_g1999, partial [Candolleomyces efflorescens]